MTFRAWVDDVVHMRTRQDRRLARSILISLAYLSGWIVWRTL